MLIIKAISIFRTKSLNVITQWLVNEFIWFHIWFNSFLSDRIAAKIIILKILFLFLISLGYTQQLSSWNTFWKYWHFVAFDPSDYYKSLDSYKWLEMIFRIKIQIVKNLHRSQNTPSSSQNTTTSSTNNTWRSEYKL